MADHLRERVALELKLTGLSARGAAELANRKAGKHVVSNQTINNFLNGDGAPTPVVRHGLALAFDWETDWPENPPASPVSELDRDSVGLILDAINGVSEDALAALRQLDERVADIQRRLEAPAPAPRTPRGKRAGG